MNCRGQGFPNERQWISTRIAGEVCSLTRLLLPQPLTSIPQLIPAPIPHSFLPQSLTHSCPNPSLNPDPIPHSFLPQSLARSSRNRSRTRSPPHFGLSQARSSVESRDSARLMQACCARGHTDLTARPCQTATAITPLSNGNSAL